jgi:hypothetical protein
MIGLRLHRSGVSDWPAYEFDPAPPSGTKAAEPGAYEAK